MRRLIQIFTLVAVASGVTATAQLKVFNHLGADLSLSTTGIGIELSSPITDYVQMRAGVSFMPGFSFNSDFDANVRVADTANPGQTLEETDKVQVKGSLARTQGDIIFNVYPFGKRNSFFVAAGAYFGGKSIVKLKGHSDRVAQLQADGTLQTGYIEVGDYKVNFEDGGNIRGGLCANAFRPYLGLGYGRPCPGKRLGFMVEAGVQFMGHMKVCEGKDLKPVDLSNLGNDDDWQKWMDKLTVYPVLKFTLCGRIF